ncbi:hypothetical protein J45TS6_45660 [Paenibacillus sp. J45TS6]|nr:hypothetical protein J45TS6_45660 [Paenibacillus sp. J45TS6]
MLWNIYLHFNDRGKLKVVCSIADIIGDGRVIKSNILSYNVTNIGRKPIYVSNIGGKYKNKDGGKYLTYISELRISLHSSCIHEPQYLFNHNSY